MQFLGHTTNEAGVSPISLIAESSPAHDALGSFQTPIREGLERFRHVLEDDYLKRRSATFRERESFCHTCHALWIALSLRDYSEPKAKCEVGKSLLTL